MEFDWKTAYERLVSKVMNCLNLLEETVLNGQISSKAVHKIIKKLIQDEQTRTSELAMAQLQIESPSKCYFSAQNEKAKNFKHETVNKVKRSKNLKEQENLNAVSLSENEIEIIDLENLNVENVDTDAEVIENTNDAESQRKEMALNSQIEETGAETNRNFQSTERETSGASDISLEPNPNQGQRQQEDEDKNDQAEKDSQTKSDSTDCKKPFKCPKCPYRAKWRINVKAHFKIVHVRQSPTKSEIPRPFPCPESGCNYAAKKASHLIIHSKIHAVEKSFSCSHPNCNFSANYEQNLISHTRIHTGEKPFVCQFESCSYAAARQGQLVQHSRTHTKERPFKCPEPNCEYTTAQKPCLRRHKVTHDPKEGEERPCFKCPICEYSGKTKDLLSQHIKSHTLEKLFKCDEPNCNYEAKAKHHVKRHKLRHSDEKPFSCSVKSCEFRCKTKDSLATHLEAHSDERPFKCELCPFRGKTKQVVLRHMQNVHFDIRPFKCTEPNCDSAFKTKTNLNRHLETHEQEQD